MAGGLRIDRDDAVTLGLQVLRHEVTGPVPMRRGAYHRDGAHLLEDRAEEQVEAARAEDRVARKAAADFLQIFPHKTSITISISVPANAEESIDSTTHIHAPLLQKHFKAMEQLELRIRIGLLTRVSLSHWALPRLLTTALLQTQNSQLREML